jgi:hypothetical protein
MATKVAEELNQSSKNSDSKRKTNTTKIKETRQAM